MEWAFTRPITKLLERAETIDSRLILAFDMYPKNSKVEQFIEDSIELLEGLRDYVVAVKFGLPTIMSLGITGVKEIISSCREYYYIADVKFADIGYIGRLIAEILDGVGFDAIIAHTIIGLKGGLEELVEEVKARNGALFALCAMSHRGAEEFLNRHFEELLDTALKLNIKSFILPATMPKYIREVRLKCPNAIIASPGIGAQGAKPGSAIESGADFEIIGRMIYKAKDPLNTARKLKEVLRWRRS